MAPRRFAGQQGSKRGGELDGRGHLPAEQGAEVFLAAKGCARDGGNHRARDAGEVLTRQVSGNHRYSGSYQRRVESV